MTLCFQLFRTGGTVLACGTSVVLLQEPEQLLVPIIVILFCLLHLISFFCTKIMVLGKAILICPHLPISLGK